MKNEIKCPKCGNVFTVDESVYAEILNQVRNDAFNEELERRLLEIEKRKAAEQKAALSELSSAKDKDLANKDAEILSLKQEMSGLKDVMANQIELAISKQKLELQSAFSEELKKKDETLTRLQSMVDGNESDRKIALMEAEQKALAAIQKKDSEIVYLKNDAKLKELQSKNTIIALNERHKAELEAKDEQIALYKDMKTKLSTKMIGETLEVHCLRLYEEYVRPYLPDAEFGKDNEVVEGTKGDFVFRDWVDGTESVSVMFEMKNEADETSKKHKNADFFNKLDSDRKKKNCEYAVLVSLLELDNELYNNGIYAVSGYEKMYVVRPQQFLTIISLLVQMGRNTVKVKRELADARERDIDVTNFENKLEIFKGKFGKHVTDAANRYNDALKDIDNAIEQLQNMKKNLSLWVDHLYKADNNFDDITIRKLTYNNPTMKKKLDEAREANAVEEM